MKDYFPEFLITFDYKNEPQEILGKLERDATELRSIDEKNPALVGHAAKDPSFMNYGENFLCSNCPYKEACDTMRRNSGEFKEQVEQAIKSRVVEQVKSNVSGG